MSTQTAVQLLMKTQQMSDPMTSYGYSLIFDFTEQIPEGQQILAYSVGLSGFSVQYATQSNSSSEEVQQFGIGLVPSLVSGSVVSVACNLLLTDYDGDATSEKQDVSGRESYAIVTVIAIIGTSPTNDWTLTNIFSQKSGASSGNIPAFATNAACSGQYIAGFDFLYSGNGTQEVNGFQFTTSSLAGNPNTNVILSGDVSMTTDSKYDYSATVSLGFLAFENVSQGQVLGVDMVTPTFSWSDPDDSSGMTGAFSASIDVPAGYEIAQAAFLMSYIYLDFKNYHDLGIIAAGLTSDADLTVSNNQVSGSLIMNLYANESVGKYGIQKDSSINGWVLVTFAPVS
jgi:hypothetical protein